MKDKVLKMSMNRKGDSMTTVLFEFFELKIVGVSTAGVCPAGNTMNEFF